MKECPRCFICLDDIVETCPLDGGPLESAFPGDSIVDGKYRVEYRLGRGGMGVVYRVRHLGLQRRFALKLILRPMERGQHFLNRFQTEARALGRLKHPSIVEVTDYGVDPRGGGLPYLVMEYLEGHTLDKLCRPGPLSPQQALPLLEAIAQAVDYAHSEGVLHCDLKPGNVIVIESGDSCQIAKILDFGLARLLAAEPDPGRVAPPQSRLESHSSGDDRNMGALQDADVVIEKEKHSGPTLDALITAQQPAWAENGTTAIQMSRVRLEGTPAYIAPELVLGSPQSASTDIYALGVLAYETLVGQLPFSGSSTEIIWKHLNSTPTVPSQVQTLLPRELDAPLLAGLSKDPAKRAKQAKDLVASVRAAWQASERVKWHAREIPRRSLVAVLAGALLALLSWPIAHLGWVEDLERRAVDTRFAFSPKHPPDQRLLALVVDEASLTADPTPLAEKADQFARLIDQVLGAGARAVAIDFLLPERWAHSEKFSRLLLVQRGNLTLAALSASSKVVGQECVSSLTASAMGPQRYSELFGFANLREDPDGVTRRANLYFVDKEGALRKSWAANVVRNLEPKKQQTSDTARMTAPFWIDYSADPRELRKISWKDLPAELQRDPSQFQGQLVLLGGDLVGSGDDYHRIPSHGSTSEAVSGLALQSLIVNTILTNFQVRPASWGPVAGLLAIGYSAFLAAMFCLSRLAQPLTFAIAFTLVYGAGVFLLFRQAHLLVPVAAPLLLGVVALGTGLVLRLTKLSIPSYVEEATR
jgi:serine/threonine protein kinase/CHASE2 domain-containing sensor protein